MDRAPVSRSRLPFASAVLDRAVALHSNLALMFFGHAPRRLPEAAVRREQPRVQRQRQYH
jgi:hypothetical protein